MWKSGRARHTCADLAVPALAQDSASIDFPGTMLLGFCTIKACFVQHNGSDLSDARRAEGCMAELFKHVILLR